MGDRNSMDAMAGDSGRDRLAPSYLVCGYFFNLSNIVKSTAVVLACDSLA